MQVKQVSISTSIVLVLVQSNTDVYNIHLHSPILVFMTCFIPSKKLKISTWSGLEPTRSKKKRFKSLCKACHPYAGAMLIFSVFFQIDHMSRRTEILFLNQLEGQNMSRARKILWVGNESRKIRPKRIKPAESNYIVYFHVTLLWRFVAELQNLEVGVLTWLGVKMSDSFIIWPKQISKERKPKADWIIWLGSRYGQSNDFTLT